MSTADIAVSPATDPVSAAPHDGVTRALHWLTVLFVLGLYGLGLIWPLLPRGDIRHGMIVTHISLGILFTAVLIVRLVWRLLPASTPQVHEGILGIVARVVHTLLYLLLFAQALFGWNWRWAQNEPLSFFGIFTIPSPGTYAPASRHMLGTLHYWTAHAIVALALGHALAALLHHYVRNDGVLQRMLPRR